MTPAVRPTARVLLLDDRDRLLLFRGVSDGGEGFWFPPGGAIEPGETAEAAAVREVREETGATVVIGPEVWTRRHVVTCRGRRTTYGSGGSWRGSRRSRSTPAGSRTTSVGQ